MHCRMHFEEGQREAQHMTRETLAEFARCDVSCLSRLEAGHVGISLDTALAIAHALGATVDKLAGVGATKVDDAAVLYTVIGTAVLHGVEPMAYVRDLVEKIGGDYPAKQLPELLPDHWLAAHPQHRLVRPQNSDTA